MRKSTAALLCLITAMIWGGGFLTASIAIETVPPAVQLMLRFVIGAIPAVLCALLRKKKKPLTKRTLVTGVLSGAVLYLAFLFQTLGLVMSDTGMNAFLTAVNVVLVPWMCFAFYRQKPDSAAIGASLLSITGIGLLALRSGSFSFGTGDVLTLICAVFFALQITILDRVHEEDPWNVNAVQMAAAAVCSLFYGLADGWPAPVSAPAWGCILYSGLGATFLCYLLQTLAQKYMNASSAGVLLATESLWANLFGFLLLHETKTPIMLAGGFLIFLSVIAAEGKDLFSSFVKKGQAFFQTRPSDQCVDE